MEDKANADNTAVEATESSPAPAKKSGGGGGKAKSSKSQQKKSTRPSTSEMVTTAIKELKDRKGSSLQAIKKYIVATYKVDAEKVAPFIRRYLKTAVSSGAVVQTKGKGASGSFKLSTDKIKTKSPKSQRASRSKTLKKAVAPATNKRSTHIRVLEKSRKPVAAKKASPGKKESPRKQQETAAKEKAKATMKTPSKAKKTAKAPAAKTKTPKPKKAAATKTVKVAAKK